MINLCATDLCMIKGVMGAELFSSGELLKAVGCTRKALRVYQQKGLIRPARDTGNKRYAKDAFARLRVIVGLREAGLSLDEIRDILKVQDTHAHPTGQTADGLAREITGIIDRVSERITALSDLRDELESSRAALLDCTRQHSREPCPDSPAGARLDAVASVLLPGE
jgi:DNA-binding transcriptional MerR regulator